MAIQKLDSLPAWTQLQWSGDQIVNRSDPYKWGGKQPPPAIGANVIVGVNSIGPGEVLGYFEEGGFLGVLVRPDHPPEWYVKQNGGDPIGPNVHPCHVFGPELKQ